MKRYSPKARPAPRRERSRLVRWWRLWRTRRPRTFTEKVRYKMLRDRRELMVTFSDKIAVRGHVASVVGPDVLPHAFHVFDDPAGLAGVALPAAYVVKPTHGSGVAVIVSDTAQTDARLPDLRHGWTYAHVRPEHAPVEHLVALGRSWLSQLYGQGPNREWAYGHVPRRLIVEEFLTGPDGAVPDDYKFFVCHGTCHYVQVDSAGFERRTQDFFTPEWTHVPLSGGHPWDKPPRPERLDEMIELAERLGHGTDFVRVDLYDLPGRIVFGELSSFPAGGDSPFEPESFNLEFGNHWIAPILYR
ncbi:MAG: hypothetical protein LH477_03335 [Nocardioides sp.]|nr:hypothetical protein [Nocardioides sp.]